MISVLIVLQYINTYVLKRGFSKWDVNEQSREKLLDTAEDIVLQQGATALTIDAVAKAMGISKGGSILFWQ